MTSRATKASYEDTLRLKLGSQGLDVKAISVMGKQPRFQVLIEILGAREDQYFVMQAAKEMGVGESRLSEIKVLGEPVDFFRLENFVFPKVGKVAFGPPVLRRFVLNHLTARPKETREKCTMCNQCINICPTNVISEKNKRLYFNYDACIRCYCCVEVCPEGAMKPTAPFLLRITG